MNPEIWARLDAIDWASLEHSYGPADDIPQALRDLTSPRWSVRRDARRYLVNSLDHQGVQRWEATARAIPFLIEFVADPTLPERQFLLDVLTDFAVGESQGVYMVSGFNLEEIFGPTGSREYGYYIFREDKGSPDDLAYGALMRRIYGEVVKGLPLYLNLLHDPNKAIRVYAAYLIGWLPTVAPQTIPALVAQLRRERSPLARSSQALALAYASLFEPTLHPIFRADLEAAFAKTQDTWECYALAVALLHLPDPTPAIKPVLMEALRQPAHREFKYRTCPWTGLQDGQWLARIMLKRAPTAWHTEILTALCDGLTQTEDIHDALYMGTLLISQLFSRAPDHESGYDRPLAVEWDGLSDMQQLVLHTFAATPLVWHFANINLTLVDYGLPVYRERMVAFVQGRPTPSIDGL